MYQPLIKLALLVAVGLMWLGLGPPALAQSVGVIRLVNENRQVNYPSELVFEVTIEGDQKISRVRLNYRIAGSRIWSYANADFKADRRVTVKFNRLLDGSVYLPPGTRLDYFYAIRDVAGNTLETPGESFTYADNRFKWQKVQVGPLALHFHDLPSSQTASIARDLTGPLAEIAQILELSKVRPIQGFIYNSHREATPAFPNLSQTITQQHVFQGFAFAEAGVFLGVGLQPGLIVHESAHLMLDQSLEPGGRQIPAWLDEGFASYIEPGSRPYSGRSLGFQGPAVRGMSAISGAPQDIEYFYLKAESVVAYLVEEFGVESFQQFLGELRQGSGVDQALESTYGFDTDGLEANWADSEVGRSAAPPGRLSPVTPFLWFNSWFLGVLILLVMMVVLVRYVYRKLRPADDELFDWDDSPPY
jgi:hypothetical protein